MRFFQFCLFLFSLIVFLQGSAKAQTKEADIKSAIETVLADLEANAEAQYPGSDMVFDGELEIEFVDGFYAVTTPHIRYNLDSQITVDVGMVAVNVLPLNAEGEIDQWSLSLAISTPVFVYRAEDMIGQLKVGEQRLSYLWIPDHDFIANYDIAFTDVEYNDFDTAKKLFIDQVALKRESQVTDNQKWDVDHNFSMSGLSLRTPEEQGFLTIDAISYEAQTKEFDVMKAAQGQQDFETLMTWHADNQQAVAVSGVLNSLQKIMSSFTRSEGELVVSGLSANSDDKKVSFEIPEFRTRSVYENSEQGFAEGDLHLNMHDTSVKDEGVAGQEPLNLTPLSMDIAYRVQNFPQLSDLLPLLTKLEQLQAEAAKLDGSDPVALQALAFEQEKVNKAFMALLQKVGLSVSLDQFNIDLPIAGLDLTGNATFEEGAKQHAVIDVTILLSGLEDASKAPQSQLGMAAMFLPMVVAVGEVVPNQDPSDLRVTRKYHIELLKDGQVLINGNAMNMGIPGASVPSLSTQ